MPTICRIAHYQRLLHALLGLRNVLAQTLALLAQRSVLLAAHAKAVRDHLEVLVARLLAVGRTAGHLLVLLALLAAKLAAALAALVDGAHALLVVCLGLLARAQNVGLVKHLGACRALLLELQGSQLAARRGTYGASRLGCLFRLLQPQFVEFGKVGRRKDLCK